MSGSPALDAWKIRDVDQGGTRWTPTSRATSSTSSPADINLDRNRGHIMAATSSLTAPTQFAEAHGIRFAYRRFGGGPGAAVAADPVLHGQPGRL